MNSIAVTYASRDSRTDPDAPWAIGTRQCDIRGVPHPLLKVALLSGSVSRIVAPPKNR
jgi:hypothetical protein